MLEFDVNWSFTVIGFIVSEIIGIIWYVPKTPLGKFYLREMEFDSETRKINYPKHAIEFVGRFLLILGFYAVAKWSGVETLGEGLLLGLFLWFFFIAIPGWGGVANEERKISLYELNVSYWLVVFLVLGVIFVEK